MTDDRLSRGQRAARGMLGLCLLALLISSSAAGQQTGVVARVPGNSTRGWKVETVPPPKPSCERDAPPVSQDGSPALPDLEFAREGLSCLRHGDGRTGELPKRPNGVSSAKGSHIAYWAADKHEVHVLSVADGADTVIEMLPGQDVRDLTWSRRGLTLAYLVTKKRPAGQAVSGTAQPKVHAINLESGKHNVFTGTFGRLVTSPDSEYVIAIGFDGVQRLRVADGAREVVIPAHYAEEAQFSASGALLGMLAITDGRALTLPPEKVFAKSQEAEDDGPDCSGGSRYLVLWKKSSRELVDVPFPKRFDSVLDFEFSPDERSVAVTYGSGESCDFPGNEAQVFVVSLTDLDARAISPADRLSVGAHWSPDGKMIVYADYSVYGPGSAPGFVAADVKTRRLARITNPGANGPDEWVGWR